MMKLERKSQTLVGVRPLDRKFAVQSDEESQRDSVPQPRVGAQRLPWVQASHPSQPQRGCGHLEFTIAATPLGLAHVSAVFPKVARSSQPSALRRNPVGILRTRPLISTRLQPGVPGRDKGKPFQRFFLPSAPRARQTVETVRPNCASITRLKPGASGRPHNSTLS